MSAEGNAAGNVSGNVAAILGSRTVLGALGWFLFLGGWYLAAHAELAPPRLFPGPEKVFLSLYELLTEKDFASDIWASVKRILISFSIAVTIALPLGLLMGAYRPIERVLGPVAGAFRYLPAPAFIPLLLMWLGTGDEQKIALLVLGVLFFLIIMLADVTRQVPKVYTETARTLGLRAPQILISVTLRSSLPGYLDVLRQMLAVSWTYLVIAEIVAATDGIGAMMMRARRFVHIDDIMAGILVIGLLGLFFDALFKLLHRTAFRYLESH
ncbi:MAG: ABC transporter permease [Haliea sp.]|nr:ABC transporter permease [Haliea sp.]